MRQQLNWESLWQRRVKMRLTIFFYKSQHAIVALLLPNVVQLPIRPRLCYPHAFQVPYCSTDAYKCSFFTRTVVQWNSFFPRTVVQWNKLPASIAMTPSLDQFKGRLAQFLCLITTSFCTVHTTTPPLPPQTIW